MPGSASSASARSIRSSKSRRPSACLRASKAASQARAKRLSAADLAKAALASRSGRAASTRRISASSSAISPGCAARTARVGNCPTLAANGALAPAPNSRTASRLLEPGRRIAGGERRREPLRGAAVVAGRWRQDWHQPAEQRLGVGRQHLGGQRLDRHVGPGAERRGEARGVERRREAGAVLADLEEERVGIVAAHVAGEGGERVGPRRGQLVEDLLAQCLGPAVLEHAELRRHAGLEREAAQQRLAEGVDGLDAQAARRLERAGEERAGAGEPIGRDRLAGLAELAQRRAELGVVEHRPGPERPEQAVLHLGGRRLGVGEAQDLLRLGAGQQQPRDAVGQHAGLARAGVGRDPARRRGRRRLDLRRDRVPHQSASRSSPSAHSPLRDRWSVSLPQVSFCGRSRAGKPFAGSR